MSELKAQKYYQDWCEREDLAEQMLPILGSLYRNKSVSVNLFGMPLSLGSTMKVLKSHRAVRQILENELSVRDTLPILQKLNELPLSTANIDLGKLTYRYLQAEKPDMERFLHEQLKDLLDGNELKGSSTDVVLYGFGRIGRMMARIMVEHARKKETLRLKAFVVRKGGDDDLEKRASLLRRDSIHGRFNGTITVDHEEQALVVNGTMIKVIYADSPDSIDYTQHGIKDAIVIDNTGKWRDRVALGLHLKSKGIAKAVLTAPGKGDIPNVVYGVNNELITNEETLFSAASCTTNAIVPVLKVVNDRFGIASGHMETCHSYTNDQNLIDNYHNKNRRGRSAPLNMVITETGAAKAVAKTLPELAGKLTGNAIRVPTPNVSMAILNLNLEKETTVKELNMYIRDVSLESNLHNQISYSNSPEVVSSDFVGNRFAGIVDGLATIVEGNRAVLYVWYDNEFGYSWQVYRMVEEMAGLLLPENV